MPTAVQRHSQPTPMLRRGAIGGRCLGLAVTAALACSGCGLTSRYSAPRKFEGVAAANPLPPAFSQPPVEPPPPAPPAALAIETPPPEAPSANAPAPPVDQALRDELDQLKAELAALKSRQEQSQAALESLTTSSVATASRAAAIEAHLALQSSLIDDLRTAAQQQQREQWKALDAVSEGIDRMLKRSEPAAVPAPVPPSSPAPAVPTAPGVSPGNIPLQEILSQQPGDSSGRKLR